METNAAPKSVRWLVIAASVFLIAGLALSGFNAYMAFAAPLQQTYAGPTMVGFEGYLTDAGGNPQDGTFDLTFRLYDVDTGGTALWTEPHSGVAVTDGLYSVLLGETVPLGPGDFSGARWLGIEVNTDGEMTPRIPISAVPWALNASGLTGHPVAAAAPQLGEALVWDGSAWAPGVVSGGDENVSVRVRMSANLATDVGQWATLPFDMEVFDNGGFHDNATNNSRLTVPAGEGGLYLIVGSACFEANINNSRIVRILLNGTAAIATTSDQGTGMYNVVPVVTIYPLAEGDYVELQAWQNANDGLLVSATASRTWYGMVKLAP